MDDVINEKREKTMDVARTRNGMERSRTDDLKINIAPESDSGAIDKE